jgi:hypothetical protein
MKQLAQFRNLSSEVWFAARKRIGTQGFSVSAAFGQLQTFAIQ